ncbi:MAG: HAMP domain-containing histidine kinase [Oscillospiraceae bacterium]|nr:HAMP domain-containing histidine kinase [Oscillospiraceae bacterium]
MWAISSRPSKRVRLAGGVQFRFALSYIALIVVLLLLLNTYPMSVSIGLVFSEKNTTLTGQALEISQALSGGEALERESVEYAMGQQEFMSLSRVAVTDEAGAILYDTAYRGAGDIGVITFEHLSRVLSGSGYEAFYSTYADGNFRSQVAVPVVHIHEETVMVIGAVYLYENDLVQGAFIEGFQRDLQNFSIGFFIAAVFLALIFFRALTRRLMDMLSAIRIVGRGDYGYKLAVRGKDELAELGRAFNRLSDRLQETEEMRRRFVSDASHELKTPLASIRLLSDSIVQSEDMEVETVREFVEDIGQEAERLTRTTERLLQLARLDAPQEPEIVPVDVARVVRRTGYMLEPLAKELNVEMAFDLAEDCLVLAVEDDVYQIVFNLAENGIKYNVEGGTLLIRLEKTVDQVRLTVEDTGIGIPEEDIPHIFDRFYRVDKARSRARGGSGLGLSIVRDTVLQHGGTIEASSRLDVGTRFVVVFPGVGEE